MLALEHGTKLIAFYSPTHGILIIIIRDVAIPKPHGTISSQYIIHCTIFLTIFGKKRERKNYLKNIINNICDVFSIYYPYTYVYT